MTPATQKTCQNLQADLASIKKLAQDFEAAFDDSIKTGNLTKAQELKAEIEARIKELKEQLIPPELRELRIERQYAAQIQVLESAGILETDPQTQEKFIAGIDGYRYPVPSLEAVMARLREKKDSLKDKSAQGFVKLVLVPFASSLDQLGKKYAARLKHHAGTGQLKTTDGTVVTEFHQDGPLYISGDLKDADKTGALVYEPTKFDPQAHGGKTKQELLTAPQPEATKGWRILLLEDLPDLPASGQGKTTGTPGKTRKQLEANKTPHAYLAEIGQGQYAHESGLIPEDWLAYALTELETRQVVIDDWQGKGKVAWLTGAYLPSQNGVPYGYWDRGDRRARLVWYGPGLSGPNSGVRPAAKI